jgi:hypothetical protein
VNLLIVQGLGCVLPWAARKRTVSSSWLLQ